MATKSPVPAPQGSPADPTKKFLQLPIFVSIINELNTNNDQLLKRQV